MNLGQGDDGHAETARPAPSVVASASSSANPEFHARVARQNKPKQGKAWCTMFADHIPAPSSNTRVESSVGSCGA